MCHCCANERSFSHMHALLVPTQPHRTIERAYRVLSSLDAPCYHAPMPSERAYSASSAHRTRVCVPLRERVRCDHANCGSEFAMSPCGLGCVRAIVPAMYARMARAYAWANSNPPRGGVFLRLTFLQTPTIFHFGTKIASLLCHFRHHHHAHRVKFATLRGIFATKSYGIFAT